tara:strand:+ start:2157 stop:2288 length:132 start_codon:yes stop_codon:yes gene_type:complete
MSGLLTCEKHSLMVGTLSHSFVLRIKDGVIKTLTNDFGEKNVY